MRRSIYIKADRATVTNIARCYARANLLDLSLARQTHGYFIQPENLLTVTVPTGLPPKATFKGEFSPDESAKTIQRASVAMGIDACKLKNSSTDEIVLKVMTVAMLMNS